MGQKITTVCRPITRRRCGVFTAICWAPQNYQGMQTLCPARFCSIRCYFFETSICPSDGLCPLLVSFNPFCFCTLSLSFHPLIYFYSTVLELVPNVYPAILCLGSCPCLLLLFSSFILFQPFQFPVLSSLISQSLLLLILLRLAQFPKSQIF